MFYRYITGMTKKDHFIVIIVRSMCYILINYSRQYPFLVVPHLLINSFMYFFVQDTTVDDCRGTSSYSQTSGTYLVFIN